VTKKLEKLDIGIATVVAAVLSALSAGVTYAVSGGGDTKIVREAAPTVTVAPSPSRSPTVHLGNLTDGQQVPTCYTVTGDAELTGDQTVAVGTRAQGDRLWYWEGSSTWNPAKTRWSVDLSFGEITNTHQYPETVMVIVARTSDIEYLASTNPKYPDNTWWSSPKPPPNALATDGSVVTRTGQSGGKSC
jgi:hypothetical protein